MRKVMVLTLGGLFLISAVVFAEEDKGSMTGKGMHQGMMQGDDMSKDMMMHKGMKDDKMGGCPMHGIMMRKMMDKTLVPTEDGGVIVMIGNKIIKYDKDLNLVKEVEIKIDIAEMQKMMKNMMKDCPMHKMMMKEGMKMEENKEQDSESK